MGREKRARLKRRSKNTRRTCRCSHHHEPSYPGRSKSLQQTTNATLTTMEKESACSCECMHDMAIMMQCNLSKLSGMGIQHIHIWFKLFTTRQFKRWLAWRGQGMGELHKIKWSGEPYLAYPNYSICCLLSDMQTTMWLHDARCKQLYEWHIQILCIFLINFHIKYFVFRVTNWKIWF
jgi:hypothetical protein